MNIIYLSIVQELVQWELSPDSCYPAHELPGGDLLLSFHNKWLGSVAPDGQLMIRLVENPVSESATYMIKVIEAKLIEQQFLP